MLVLRPSKLRALTRATVLAWTTSWEVNFEVKHKAISSLHNSCGMTVLINMSRKLVLWYGKAQAQKESCSLRKGKPKLPTQSLLALWRIARREEASIMVSLYFAHKLHGVFRSGVLLVPVLVGVVLVQPLVCVLWWRNWEKLYPALLLESVYEFLSLC